MTRRMSALLRCKHCFDQFPSCAIVYYWRYSWKSGLP